MEPCRYRAVPINSHWGKREGGKKGGVGDSKTFPARSLAPPFRLKLQHFYYHFTLISQSLSDFPSFFYPEVNCRFFIHETAPRAAPPPLKPVWICKTLYTVCFWKMYESLNMFKCRLNPHNVYWLCYIYTQNVFVPLWTKMFLTVHVMCTNLAKKIIRKSFFTHIFYLPIIQFLQKSCHFKTFRINI